MKKTPKKLEYTLTLTPEQAQALVYAGDVYLRMSLAQIDTAVSLTLAVPDDALPIVRELCNALKFAITGMAPNASYGVGSKEINKTTHTIHAIEQTIRHRLAWDRKPEGGMGVDFGEPLLLGGVSAPVIKNNLDMTVDGWLTHKPKPVDGARYYVRLPDQYKSASRDDNISRIVKRRGVYYLTGEGTKYKEAYSRIGDDTYQWKLVKRSV